jgi:hypothetical protein
VERDAWRRANERHSVHTEEMREPEEGAAMCLECSVFLNKIKEGACT